MWIFCVIMSFLSGSIPFSVLVVSRFLGRDVRNYGDGNPGTVNAFKAGGLRYGLAVGMLDFLKGALKEIIRQYHVCIKKEKKFARCCCGALVAPFSRLSASDNMHTILSYDF